MQTHIPALRFGCMRPNKIGFLGYIVRNIFVQRSQLHCSLILQFLSRKRAITSKTGLSSEIIELFHLEDWSNVVSNPFSRSVLISRYPSWIEIENRSDLREPTITKREFLERTAPTFDGTSVLPFNGIKFSYRQAEGIIRFVHDLICLDFHEILLYNKSQNFDFSDSEKSLITLICETLNC